MFESFVLVVHVLVAIGLCGLVLLQHGKGADMGAAFGSGSSGSLFGASGSANFLSRSTAVLAAVFFLSSLGLTYLGATRTKSSDPMQGGVMSTIPAPKATDVPKAADVPTAPSAPAVPAPATGSGTPSTGTPPAGVPSTGTPPTGVPSKAGEVPK
jgi:preprotein translocase subunit SecG